MSVETGNDIADKNSKSNSFDSSTWLLVFSNVATIVYAVYNNWDLNSVMLVYWSQSVIIGLFNFIRILQLKNFSTEGFTMNGGRPEPNKKTKIQVAFFFLAHYGIFHFAYLIFLLATLNHGWALVDGQRSDVIRLIFGGSVLFFINHLYSYFYNRKRDSQKVQNIGRIMFYPYARIIPMHLTILFGGIFLFGGVSGIFVLPFFLVLKTAADVIMHISEHK